MNYEKLYKNFVLKFKNQTLSENDYTEVHHILPRYCGGGDSEDNLVIVTFKQHVFLHHLWARATNDPEAWFAYRMMKGVPFDHRREYAKLGGLKNVRTGHLDRIRPLANTPERQRKLRETVRQMMLDGRFRKFQEASWEANRGRVKTVEEREHLSKVLKDKFENDPSYREQQIKKMAHAQRVKCKKVEDFAKRVIENSQSNVEWLSKTSKISKNKFISPEGLEFDSPIFAANYYGNVKPYVVENWCKRGQYGWSRVPKEK